MSATSVYVHDVCVTDHISGARGSEPVQARKLLSLPAAVQCGRLPGGVTWFAWVRVVGTDIIARGGCGCYEMDRG
jgi:hypothetical protein